MSGRAARAGQISLGLLWLIDGGLQFQPYMFGKSFVTGVLLPSAAGQPGFIGAPIGWVAHLIEPHVALFNAFAATLEVLIGLGLLHRRTVRAALAVSFAWAAGIWFGGEGLGMLFTGTASPLTGAPGAALLYVLAGLMCWPSEPPLLGGRAQRFAWSALWIGSAALWSLPANSSAGGARDAIAIALAIVSGAIGLAVLYRWHTQAFLGLAIALSLAYWVVGQQLGGVFTGQATDVGSGPPMVLIAWMLMRREAGKPSRVASRTSMFVMLRA